MPIDYEMEYISKSIWVNNFFLLLDKKGLTFCWIRGLFSLTGDQTQSEIARQSKTYQGGRWVKCNVSIIKSRVAFEWLFGFFVRSH